MSTSKLLIVLALMLATVSIFVSVYPLLAIAVIMLALAHLVT